MWIHFSFESWERLKQGKTIIGLPLKCVTKGKIWIISFEFNEVLWWFTLINIKFYRLVVLFNLKLYKLNLSRICIFDKKKIYIFCSINKTWLIILNLVWFTYYYFSWLLNLLKKRNFSSFEYNHLKRPRSHMKPTSWS